MGSVMSGSSEALARASGSATAADFLKRVAAAMIGWLKEEAGNSLPFQDNAAVVAYLRAAHAHQPRETLRILFLDAANRLLRDEQIFSGTIDQAPLWPREIIGRALELHAAALILVHNHPSGDPAPSPDDVAATRRLTAAAELFGIAIHDHLILARRGTTSLRALGHLQGESA